MAHELAGAFQQSLGIGDLSAAKEPDIDVRPERIDIGERRITHTRGRMAIMQYLSNVVSAVAHDREPAPRDRSHFARMPMHPDLDCWISLERTEKVEEFVHGDSCRRA